jgi:integrase
MDGSSHSEQVNSPQESVPRTKRFQEWAWQSLSKSSQKAYAADGRGFECWCQEHQRSPLPADPQTVKTYFESLAQLGRAASTIDRKAVTISLTHQHHSFPSPCDRREQDVRDARIPINKNGAERKRKTPLSVELLNKVLVAYECHPLLAARDRALFLIGFAGALRCSELAAIKIEDIKFDELGITIQVPSKALDRRGKRREVVVRSGNQSENTPLQLLTCPVRALTQWLEIADIHEGPVFRSVRKYSIGATALRGDSIGAIFKSALQRAGLSRQEAERYGTHSLRSGFVMTAYNNGAGEGWITAQTGHRSSLMLDSHIPPEKQTHKLRLAAGMLGL